MSYPPTVEKTNLPRSLARFKTAITGSDRCTSCDLAFFGAVRRSFQVRVFTSISSQVQRATSSRRWPVKAKTSTMSP